MSRIGKKPIELPSGVTASLDGQILKVKGPKGELSLKVSYEVAVEVTDKSIEVKQKGKTKNAPMLWGTTRALINNMVIGVTEGFEKTLELQGVGYKMAVQGNKLNLNLGFSHPVNPEIPEGLTAEIEKSFLTIKGMDRQKVGQFAAEIRSLKPVEPYKGRGFRYKDEEVIRKEGKKAASE
ncbi:MAG TPA: 50S ribosomal protein L6 [Candidatus Moranbacteria bacterium]|nr:50S ribosomal protein L6 [Candidatus Moranbacteria bacterium]